MIRKEDIQYQYAQVQHVTCVALKKCWTNSKELGIKVGESTPDGKFSLTCLRCVGACGLSPVVTVGTKTFGRVSPDKVKDILKEFD